MVQSSKLSDRFKNSEKLKAKIPQFRLESSANNKEKNQIGIVPLYDDSFDIEIKKALLAKVETIPVWFDYTLDKQRELIASFVSNKLCADGKELSDSEREGLITHLLSAISGFGPLDYLINQENVSAIFVSGVKTVFIEIAGKVLNTEIKLNKKQLDFILKNIANLSENKPNEVSYVWNCKVKDMWVSVIHPPLASDEASIIIRKVHVDELDMRTLLNEGFLNRDIFEFLLSVLNSKKNIIISGDINSGKTFLLNTLINRAFASKRGVLIEEFPQLLTENDNMMKFSLDALKTKYDFDVLVSSILKMSPEYVIIDSNNPNYFSSSVVNFSDSNGTVITVRAGSPDSAIQKFISAYAVEDKCMEKQAKISLLKAFDYIVQINKFEDGKSRISSVIELAPTKTSALSLKEIVKWENNQYITDIPQPLTSIKSSSEFVNIPEGSMKARFYSLQE